MEKKFLWGAAMSPHQVEGGNDNDWTEWERKKAEKLAEEAEDHFGRLKIWEDIREKAEDAENYISGRAVDHRNRYRLDFDIAGDLGLNSVRTGIEWSRIQPSEGEFDEEEIEFYRKYLKNLSDRNIEPMVTLWHFTHPKWFVERGGWHQENSPERFQEYVEKIVSELGHLIDYWITLNEPAAWIRPTYRLTSLLPGQRNWTGANLEESRFPGLPRPIKALKAYRNLTEAHQTAYNTIKKSRRDSKIGTANSIGVWKPVNGNTINKKLAKLIEILEYRNWIEKNLEYFDFIGVNHYAKFDIDIFGRGNDYEKTDMGWPIEYCSLEEVLEDISEYGKPLIVTEHGLADRSDDKRQRLIRETIPMIKKRRDDLEIKGYYHWSLLDNFEWDSGFWPRFGLVEIDYENDLERNIRESARIYSKLIDSEKKQEKKDQVNMDCPQTEAHQTTEIGPDS